MAGNRQREKAFQIPLLIELAVQNEPAQAGRGRRTHDLAYVRDNVLEFFRFTRDQRNRTRRQRNGREYNILDNEVDYAFDQLEARGEVTRKRVVKNKKGDQFELNQWEITPKGLARIRQFVQEFIEHYAEEPTDQLDRLIHLRNGDGPEFLILLIRGVENDHLAATLNCCETVSELLLETARLLSDAGLRSFLLEFWEVIRDEFFEDNRQYYESALSQV